MHFRFIFSIFAFILLGSFFRPMESNPGSSRKPGNLGNPGTETEGIWKTILVEDFESIELDESNWRIRKYKEDPLPQVYMTKNITAPIPGSRRAVLFRFSDATNVPGQFLFPNPYEFVDFLGELEIPVYSSKSGGSLVVLVQTHDYENKQIFLTNLNYRGWKTIRVSLRDKLNQNDPVFRSGLVVRFLGILYEPGPNKAYGTEILVGIDDIRAKVRTKYKPLISPVFLD
jgi:hypothetical protein